MIVILILASLFSPNSRAQISFKEPDTARIAEGDIVTRDTAQYLLRRELFAREAIQIGRTLFHHDFASSEKSGCNALPCERRGQGATRSGPDSRLEASSCATCHSTPAGSAGFGAKDQDTFTSGNRIRAPDLFGSGLIQQLAIEATDDLRSDRAHRRRMITSNGVDYEEGLGIRDGGTINADLRARPFGRKGVESHVRAFTSRAAAIHMGIQAQDRFQCPAGDRDRDGRCDGPIEAGIDPDVDIAADELTQGGLSLLEHYLINYPVPGRGPITARIKAGERLFKTLGCAECHRPAMRVRNDPRLEHLTVFWSEKEKRFEAERRLLYHARDDGYLDPNRQRPVPLADPDRKPFTVALYSDLKRHEMGPAMADSSDEEGVSKSVFITRPLWGVGSYRAFLHDGGAASLEEAILRHGGEARTSRKRFAALSVRNRNALIAFLKSLVLFSVNDVLTAKIPITKGDVP